MAFFITVPLPPLQELSFSFIQNHAASNPAKTTFNLITPPPPKKMAFGGGGDFFEIFSWIFGFGTQKKFWKDFGAKPMFWNNYRPLPAILWFGEIQKITDFQHFWANLATFFFKIQFWTKLALESLKMIFLTFFRSWRWFILIFIHFGAFKILSFYAFFMLKSVVFSSFDAAWLQWHSFLGDGSTNLFLAGPRMLKLFYFFGTKLEMIFMWYQSWSSIMMKFIKSSLFQVRKSSRFGNLQHFLVRENVEDYQILKIFRPEIPKI